MTFFPERAAPDCLNFALRLVAGNHARLVCKLSAHFCCSWSQLCMAAARGSAWPPEHERPCQAQPSLLQGLELQAYAGSPGRTACCSRRLQSFPCRPA